MRKSTLFILAGLIAVPILFSACDPVRVSGTPEALWSIGTMHYGATSVDTAGGKQIMASGNNNSIQVFFPAFPTLDTLFYHVVSESKAANNTLASNECAVEMTTTPGGSNENDFLSLANNTDSIEVDRDPANGKYEVLIPSLQFGHFMTPSSGIPILIDTLEGGDGFIQQ
jgi:hypothetical protein